MFSSTYIRKPGRQTHVMRVPIKHREVNYLRGDELATVLVFS